MSNQEIVQAYRALYRATLRAIHYAKPSRYDARDTLRNAFRNEPASNFSQDRIANTLAFLGMAEHDNGMEHKILKNLLHVKFWRRKPDYTKVTSVRHQTELDVHIRKTKYAHFDNTLGMLNETLGLCLR